MLFPGQGPWPEAASPFLRAWGPWRVLQARNGSRIAFRGFLFPPSFPKGVVKLSSLVLLPLLLFGCHISHVCHALSHLKFVVACILALNNILRSSIQLVHCRHSALSSVHRSSPTSKRVQFPYNVGTMSLPSYKS